MAAVDSVHTSGGLRAPGAASGSSPAKPAGASFAEVQAAVTKKAAEKKPTETTTPKLPVEPLSADEAWKQVKGRPGQAEITEGPRAGKFVNLSGNSRHGQTFVKEVREGKTFHVYGEGESRLEVKVGDGASRSRGLQPPAKETWAPVPGHLGYADILGGPRNGYFVNLSGNERHGLEFRIEQRRGQLYHVYGEGRDLREIHAGEAPKKADKT